MNEQGFDLVKYNDDHFVLHMDRRALAMLLAVQSFFDSESESICSMEMFQQGLKALCSSTDVDDLLPADVAIYDHVRQQLSGSEYDHNVLVTFPVGATAEGSYLWCMLKPAVPVERHAEVLAALATVKARGGADFATVLSAAFLWDTTPQGREYWARWQQRTFDSKGPLPEVWTG